MSPSFGPDRSLPIREGRPALKFNRRRLVRLCVLLFRLIVYPWLFFRQRKMETRVNAKLDRVERCRGREELEQLLGKPVYAVSGESCGAVLDDGTQEIPDRIECYESDGCCIDLWFKDDRLVDVSGFVKPTVWDLALAGGAERS